MEQFSQAVSEIQGKFEGGVSFNVNWFDLAGEARRNMLRNINPRSAKRRVPVYGGIAGGVPVYTCPSDVSVPAEFYPTPNSLNGREYKYRAPKQFYQQAAGEDYNVFTIDFINGVPFILARTDRGTSLALINSTDPADFTGNVALTATTNSYLGNSGALFGTFDDTSFNAIYALGNVLDISAYTQGIITVPFEMATVSKLEYIEIHLRTDDSNYFVLRDTIAGISTSYFNNWNISSLEMSKRTQVGSPSLDNINSVVANLKMNTGETEKVTLDQIQLHKTQAAMFEYYSHNIFKDPDGTFKAKPTKDDDTVLLQEEEYHIWQYEVCTLLVQNATYDGIDSKESERFARNLKDSYDAYHTRFPSMEEPMTYNIGSEVDLDNGYTL